MQGYVMTQAEINDRITLLKRTCTLCTSGAYVISAKDGLFLIQEIEDLREENKKLGEKNVERFNGFGEDLDE